MMLWIAQEPQERAAPDAQGDDGRRRSRLSSSGPPRVTQMVAPMLKPANAAPLPQRLAPAAPRPARALAAAARGRNRRAAGRDAAPRRGSVSAAAPTATSSAAESAEQPSSACDDAEDIGGALSSTAPQTSCMRAMHEDRWHNLR